MFSITIGYGYYYEFNSNKDFMDIIKCLCVLLIGMINYCLWAIIFTTHTISPLPASVWRVNETFCVITVVYAILWNKYQRDNIKENNARKSSFIMTRSGFISGSTPMNLMNEGGVRDTNRNINVNNCRGVCDHNHIDNTITINNSRIQLNDYKCENSKSRSVDLNLTESSIRALSIVTCGSGVSVQGCDGGVSVQGGGGGGGFYC
eukprot:Pgem_evm1s2037